MTNNNNNDNDNNLSERNTNGIRPELNSQPQRTHKSNSIRTETVNKNESIRTEFRKFKQPKKSVFLEAYARAGTALGAEKLCGVNRMSHKTWLEADPEYAAAAEEAEQAYLERLLNEVDRRAVEGVDDLIMYEGKICKDDEGNTLVKRRFSDNLLMFRVKQMDPSFRDSAEVIVKHGLDAVSINDTLNMLQAQGLQLPDPTIAIEEGEVIEQG